MTAADTEDEREEELGSLIAIYPELLRNEQHPFSATLELEVTPSKPLLARFVPNHAYKDDKPVTYAQAASKDVAHIEHDLYLSHLPPLLISLELPDGYPSSKPPVVHLTTQYNWLPRDKVEDLESQCLKLWDEYGQCQILFSYVDFLQQSVDDGFDLPNSSDGCLELHSSQEKSLVDFDCATALAKFRKGTYDCEICLEPKKGSSCYRMENCPHVFCLQCLQDYYNNAIIEGDVVNVRCLSPDCGKEAPKNKRSTTLHPRELLAMGIDDSKVRRYLELKRKKMMEADKSTVYCPRTWCQSPARSSKYPPIPKNLAEYIDSFESSDLVTQAVAGKTEVASADPSDRLVVCEKCELAFCRICYVGWHGPFQRCYPRDPNELSVEEQASYEYIRTNTSPCPTCNSPTQKTMGCNHMKCFQCNTHYCYLCGAWLLPDNPYVHFNTGGSPCYQRLWELEEGDEGQNPADGQGFAGGRGYEQMAIEVAREAEAREAEAEAERIAAQGAREAEELRLFAMAEQDASSDDELGDRLQQLHLNRAQPVAAPQAQAHAPGQAAQNRRDPPRERGARRGGRGQGVNRAQPPRVNGHQVPADPAEADVDAQRLRRFLDLAARDEEDEWDSDELGDEQDFVIH